MKWIRARTGASGEAGFALLEVVVSAVIAVTMTGAVVQVLNASGHSSSEDRHRSQAFAIAQEDQARMRGMRIASLNAYSNSSPVVISGVTYTVKSTASFVNDKTTTQSCESGKSSVDYVKTASEVSWTGSNGRSPTPIVLASIITPPNGSLDPTHGSLVFRVANSQEVPISNVKLQTTGTSNPASLNGTTETAGCVIFIDKPEGNYTITPTLAAGYVNELGETPAAEVVGIVGNSTKTVLLHYDKEAALKAEFKVRPYAGGTPQASSSDSMMVVQNQWTAQKKLYGTPGGTRTATLEAKPLYPFKSSEYTFYAGACEENLPTSGATTGGAILTAGNTSTVALQLPALYITVKGENNKEEMKALSGARVRITDEKCTYASSPIVRKYETEALGRISDPGLPWSTYKVCISGSITTRKASTGPETETQTRIIEKSGVVVHSTEGTSLEFQLKGKLGSGGATTVGTCP